MDPKTWAAGVEDRASARADAGSGSGAELDPKLDLYAGAWSGVRARAIIWFVTALDIKCYGWEGVPFTQKSFR